MSADHRAHGRNWTRTPRLRPTETGGGPGPPATVVGTPTTPACAIFDGTDMGLTAHHVDGTPMDWHSMVHAIWNGDLDPTAVVVTVVAETTT